MKLSKAMAEKLEVAFSVLRENINSKVGTDEIASVLKEITDYDYVVKVIPKKVDDPKAMWVMSVYPEISTIDKIVNGIMNMDDKTLKKLWEKNKVWTVELDERIFFNSSLFTNRELTAMLLHEIGHVIYSNSITTRISNILNYELAKNRHLYQGISKTGIFKSILSLPIINLCVSSQSKDKSITNEINADRFASSLGYRKDLVSAFSKIIESSKGAYGSTDIDKNLDENMKFTSKMIEQFKQRKDKLMKKNLLSLKENCESEVMESVINTIFSEIFFKEDSDEDDMIKIESFHRRMDDAEAEYMREAFIGDKYPPIDPSTFDYIDIKTAGIKTLDDKMMLAVYIQSKIDMLNQYLKIIRSGSHKAKKIPYTEEDIMMLKERLLNQKEAVIDARLPGRNPNILVAWPEGYEG